MKLILLLCFIKTFTNNIHNTDIKQFQYIFLKLLLAPTIILRKNVYKDLHTNILLAREFFFKLE